MSYRAPALPGPVHGVEDARRDVPTVELPVRLEAFAQRVHRAWDLGIERRAQLRRVAPHEGCYKLGDREVRGLERTAMRPFEA